MISSSPELGRLLLTLARNAIAAELQRAQQQEKDDPALHQAGASFVTLTQQERLRGCIGSLQAWRPLAADVRANARAAAFHDPRFPPLSDAEFARTRVEVSLLGEAEPLLFASEADACRQLRPGVDGVILEVGGQRGTFLPQVWDALPDPVVFLAHLKEKAGLPADYWSSDLRLSRYEVEKWKEAAQP